VVLRLATRARFLKLLVWALALPSVLLIPEDKTIEVPLRMFFLLLMILLARS
jgi:hypothetical protein